MDKIIQYRCSLCGYTYGEDHEVCPVCNNGENKAWTAIKDVKAMNERDSSYIEQSIDSLIDTTLRLSIENRNLKKILRSILLGLSKEDSDAHYWDVLFDEFKKTF